MSSRITHRIAFRLAATVFVCALVIGEFLSLVHIALDYWNARTSMEAEIGRMMNNTRGASAEALRRTDRRSANQIIRGFMNLNSVYAASLVDSFGLPLSSMDRSLSTGEADWIFRTFAEGKRHFLLPIFAEGKIEPVGSVQVSVDTHYIYGNAIRRGKYLMMGALLTALLIGAATHWIAHRRLTRNLEHLRGYVRAAALGEMPPEALELPSPGSGQELDTLALAVNDFTLSLRQQIAEAEWKTRRARSELHQATGDTHAPARSAPQAPADDLQQLDQRLRLDTSTRVLLGGADPEGAAAILAALSLAGDDRPGLCDAAAVVAESISILSPLLGHSIRLHTATAPAPLPSAVSRETLMRWILRCVTIARDDMPLGGTLSIESALEPSPSGHAGPHARITIADTGIGAGPEALSGLKPGDRSPLRERITRPIAALGGGFVEIQTADELGTRVHLLLPLETPPPAWMPDPDTLALVVHRDPSVIKAVALHLRAAGIVVLEAPSATTAVERAMDSLTPVRLVLIEEHLPEADAGQVVERLREHAPGLRVIPLRESPGSGAGLLLPFGPAALLAAVRGALDAPPDTLGPG